MSYDEVTADVLRELVEERKRLRAEVERLRAEADARAVEELGMRAEGSAEAAAKWARELRAATHAGHRDRLESRINQLEGVAHHIRARIAELSKPAAKESEPVEGGNTFTVYGVTFTADPGAPRSAVQQALECIMHAFASVTTMLETKPEEPDWTVEMVRRSDDTRNPPEGCEDSLIQIRLLSLVVEGLCNLGREVRRGGES